MRKKDRLSFGERFSWLINEFPNTSSYFLSQIAELNAQEKDNKMKDDNGKIKTKYIREEKLKSIATISRLLNVDKKELLEIARLFKRE